MQIASKSNNYNYNKKLQPFAKELRMNMTKAEACIWKYVLKSGKLNGYKFRRQRPVLNYIADFMCFDLMLITEVNGLTHSYDQVVNKDITRQKALESAGFKVLRFNDEEVLNDIENVENEILGFIDKYEKSTPAFAETATCRQALTPASGGCNPLVYL